MEMTYGKFNLTSPNEEFRNYYEHYLSVLKGIQEKASSDITKMESVEKSINEITSILK